MTPGPTRRWPVLLLIALAQLMIVVDHTIINVALPSAQVALGFDDPQRQWVVISYALSFGALLLVGGTVSDRLGRRAAFVTGLVGFAVASAVGGAAPNVETLLAARAAQGVFGALLAPTTLALLTETYPGGRARGRAFGMLGAIVGSGAAGGLVLGGVLTELLSWRATMYVNVVFAAVLFTGVLLVLPPGRRGPPRRWDRSGALTGAGGLFGVVLGLANAEHGDWLAPEVLGPLVAGVLLLAAFVVRQVLATVPLLPLRVFADRDRAGGFVNRFIASTGNFAVVFFLTFFLQRNLGLSPSLTGVAMIPMVLGVVGTSNLSGPLLSALGPRSTSVIGLAVSGGALLWLGLLEPATDYWTGVLPPLLVFGLGQGMTTTVALNLATARLDPGDVGVGSATVTVMQQIGGSVGTALLTTIAGLATAAHLAAAPGTGTDARNAAEVHGYGIAFTTAGAVFLGGALVCGVLVRGRAAHAERSRADAHLPG